MNKPDEAPAGAGGGRIEAAVAKNQQKSNQDPAQNSAGDENTLVKQRRQKAEQIKELGLSLYPNTFRPRDSIGALIKTCGQLDAARLESQEAFKYSLAGRIMAIRSFGKAAFLKITDRTGSLQLHLERDLLPPEQFKLFKKLDVGDIIGVMGHLFRTRTRELTLKVEQLNLVTKAMRPLPEKFHGLTDVEQRYRQRYLDLIMNEQVRSIFQARSTIVSTLRNFLTDRDFLEVETPMMQAIPGGATARPFETHHNALNMKLYLRVAPELYLKRLVVGGLERVFELNRNFRNEGVSVRHNPEFTMLEFYQAYATYEDLITMTEEMFGKVAMAVTGSLKFDYQGRPIDLTPPWQSIDFRSSLLEMGGVPPEVLFDREKALNMSTSLGGVHQRGDNLGKALAKIFDVTVETNLWQPTFVTGFPRDISPLSRTSDLDPDIVDRFEFFIACREMGNGFSELNDPDDQRSRFNEQVAQREAGDDEAQFMDLDYVRALEFGMPPTAGEGVGIDRLVMLMTDQPSIREVILFPLLRLEQG
ncbi:MAG: lysine--tRNA ligase [Proteobacteria bacterium]|nr:lysine--tRNA ligase [Pseudomonadota bacterium]MBU1453005.1 lysine--tRNA ligase [Pseudomonadota bacterium]MBU2469498.1 lysine--tRNA ligase [Pseudomonadota bacterium]MBU2518827.1 lysine--tRNA ligase [Pseudomonadota bacterium]